MRPPRGPSGPGVIVLLAVMVAIPEIVRQCKPLAKTIGETLVKLGEGLKSMADTEEVSAAPAEATADGVREAEFVEETVTPVNEVEIAAETPAEEFPVENFMAPDQIEVVSDAAPVIPTEETPLEAPATEADPVEETAAPEEAAAEPNAEPETPKHNGE